MRIIAIILIAMLVGCKTKLEPVLVFFDPSGSMNVKSYRISIIANNKHVLDTTVENNHINRSDLIKSLDIPAGQDVCIQVNDKQRMLRLDTISSFSGCINLFIGYDDRIKIRKLYDLYTANSIKTTGKTPNYKKFLDSLTYGPSLHKYDSLTISMKKTTVSSKYLNDNYTQNRVVIPHLARVRSVC